MRKTLILLLAALALFSPTAIFAHKDKHAGSSKFEVKIESEDDEEDEFNLGIGGQSFQIRGEISLISGNSFTILDQTIVVDPSAVSEFKQKGILKVGNTAKVEGKIINGTKYAKEIKIIGQGQGRFKFEIKSIALPAQSSPSPSPSPSSSPTSDISESPSPSPSPSPSATPSANVSVKIKASGPVDQVIEFISQILSFLETLI